MRVCGAFRFCQHVFYANAFQYGTHSTAGNYTGTGSSRFHENESTAIFSFLLMRDSTFQYRDFNKVLFSIVNAFSDSGGNFLRFSQAVANDTVFVTNDNDSGEAKGSTTFCYFRYSIHSNQSIFKFDIG